MIRDLILRPRHDEAAWVAQILSLEPPQNPTELRKAIYLLASAHQSVVRFGDNAGGDRSAAARTNAEAVARKCAELTGWARENREVFDDAQVHRFVELLERTQTACDEFLLGNSAASFSPDVGLLAATLPAADSRSTRRLLGISGKVLRNHDPDTTLANEYRRASVLGPDTIQYLLHDVPVERTQAFFSLFSAAELLTFADDLSSPAIAESIAADSASDDYLLFVALLVRENLLRFDSAQIPKEEYEVFFPELDWSEPQFLLTVLFKALPGTVNDKVARLAADIRTHSLMLEDIVRVLAIRGFGHDSFEQLCKTYEGTFAPFDIIQLHASGCDLDQAKALWDELPAILQFPPVIQAFLTDPKYRDADPSIRQEFIGNFSDGEDTFTYEMLEWFFDAHEEATRAVQLLRAAGIHSFGAMYDMDRCAREQQVPLEYWIELRSALGNIYPGHGETDERVRDYYTHGITADQLLSCAGLWDTAKGLEWHVVDAESVAAYLRVLADPAKKEVIERVCSTQDLVPCEIVLWVDKGYTADEFDTLHRIGAPTGCIEVVRAIPTFAPQFEALSDEDKAFVLFTVGMDGVAPLAADPPKTLVQIIAERRASMPPPLPDSAAEPDPYLPFLDRASARHAHYIQLFRLFGITPEYMSRQLALAAHGDDLTDVLVNHIILCAYAEDTLAPGTEQLVDRYGIEMFSRYPASALHSMVQRTPESSPRRRAIILRAKSDWNDAGDDMTDTVDSMTQHHDTRIYEVATKADYYRVIRALGEELAKEGKTIDLVYFSGHGSASLLQMGYPYSRTNTELTKESIGFMAPLRRFLSPDAQLVLASCSNAKGGGTADNVARAFADAWRGVEVFAANSTTSARGIVCDPAGRVTSVRYGKSGVQEVIKIDA